MATESASKEHQRRAGKNQSLFRDVNKRVSDVNKAPDLWVTLSDWACECADDTCAKQLQLTPGQYESVLKNPTHFAVLPDSDHVAFGVERVVEKRERFWIVAKRSGRPQPSRQELDPRSRSISS